MNKIDKLNKLKNELIIAVNKQKYNETVVREAFGS